MLRLAFDFIITWRETRTRPNAYNLTAILDSILGGVQEKHLTGRKWNVYKFRYRLSKCSKQSLMSIIVWKTPNK